METLGAPLIVVGIILVLIGWFMVVVAAFREHVLWGLACLLVKPVLLFYVIAHWDDARKGFLVWLTGFAVMVMGALAFSTRIAA